MPIPVAIPAGAKTIDDTITALAEQWLAVFIQIVKSGTSGAAVNTPASTVSDQNAGTASPVVLDTPEKQLFYRQLMVALGSTYLKRASSEVVGTTANPSSVSVAFVLLPEMTLALTTNGGPVLVLFSSTLSTLVDGDSFDYAIFVDGVEVVPSERRFDPPGATNIPGSTQALLTLAAGAHTFEVRWKAVIGSAAAFGTDRSLTVVELH